MSTIQNPGLVTDISSLTGLRAQAAKDPQGQAKTVARQFESLFIQQMIKSMRAASPGDPLMDSSAMQTFRDMQDQQLASNMANAGGIGLSDFMLRQITPQGGQAAKILPPRPDGFPSLDLKMIRDKARQTKDAAPKEGEPQGKQVDVPTKPAMVPAALAFRALPSMPSTPNAKLVEGGRICWDEPTGFVRDLMPHARQAAARLGVDPQVLIAQSALETGWGKHLPTDGAGRNNMNLFGIKANSGWSGDRTVSSTLEYENGAMVRKSEPFRSYGSIRGAFDDYVNFLQSNPRYAEALKHAGDNERFVQELQKAGYATDPNYADKILSILRDSPLTQAG